jgi:hypothetical protein
LDLRRLIPNPESSAFPIRKSLAHLLLIERRALKAKTVRDGHSIDHESVRSRSRLRRKIEKLPSYILGIAAL